MSVELTYFVHGTTTDNEQKRATEHPLGDKVRKTIRKMDWSKDKMKFFIIHGTGGEPDGNWFPWLKQKLEEQGHEVVVPDFPGIENQSLETWMDAFNQYCDEITGDTVFVAHSVAPAFVLNLLERGLEAKACFFVSGFTGLLGNKFDEPNKTITDRDFNFEEIKDNCSYFKLYHSPDDPYVPMEKAENLAEKLGAELEIIEDGGHLNELSGYSEFPKLLEDIEVLA
jgi:predicted alpha/beta hydrolase family esterase